MMMHFGFLFMFLAAPRPAPPAAHSTSNTFKLSIGGTLIHDSSILMISELDNSCAIAPPR